MTGTSLLIALALLIVALGANGAIDHLTERAFRNRPVEVEAVRPLPDWWALEQDCRAEGRHLIVLDTDDWSCQ